jgi:hypothetical protein
MKDKPEPSTTIKTDRSPKGSGTTVTADLKDFPALLEKIRLAAKADDRETSNYLRRRLVDLDRQGLLVTAPENGTLIAETK